MKLHSPTLVLILICVLFAIGKRYIDSQIDAQNEGIREIFKAYGVDIHDE